MLPEGVDEEYNEEGDDNDSAVLIEQMDDEEQPVGGGRSKDNSNALIQESPETLEVDGGAIVTSFDENSLGIDEHSQQSAAEDNLMQPEALTTPPVATIEEPPSDFGGRRGNTHQELNKFSHATAEAHAQGEDTMLDENVGESGEQIEQASDRAPSADDSQEVPPMLGEEHSTEDEEGDTGEGASDEGEPDEEVSRIILMIV